MNIHLMSWIPIGPGDPDSVWIETEEDKEKETKAEEETVVEIEYDKENETNKENK